MSAVHRKIRNNVFAAVMTLLIAAAATAAFTPAEVWAKSSNLLTNGNGESGNITGWKHNYSGFNNLYHAAGAADFFSYSNISAHSGKYCILSDSYISCSDSYSWHLSPYLTFSSETPDESVVELYQDVDLSSIAAGTELILRGYVGGEGTIKAAFYDGSGKVLSSHDAKDRSVKDDSGWKYQRAAVKIPAGARKIRISLISAFYRFSDGYGRPCGEYTRGAFDDVTLKVKEKSSYKPTAAKSSGEILKNGGGEKGSVTGWFYEYEDFTVFHPVRQTDFFSRSNVQPHSGSYCLASDFFWHAGDTYYLGELLSFSSKTPDTSTVSMYQTVKLSGLAAGTTLKLKGYVAGEANISMVFYNSAGKKLLTAAGKDQGDEVNGWKAQAVTAVIPSKASTVRVYLHAGYGRFADGYGRPYGEYTRGAFDDISLTASSPDKKITVGQVKNLKVTNVAKQHLYVSFSKVSGAKGYQIRAAKKKSMVGARTWSGGPDAYKLCYLGDKNRQKVTFEKDTTYYVQVRAYKTKSSGVKVYGKWSAKKSVKIKK